MALIRSVPVALLVLSCSAFAAPPAPPAPAASTTPGTRPADHLACVRTFADTLLQHGLDRFGDRHTALWCGVIDAETLSVPRSQVPNPRGVRAGDRAVGGSNLYHDAVTLHVFRALSRVTGEERYQQAARAYVKDFLATCQSPDTGLLAWGEHLYYDVFADRVVTERKSHELLEGTPPWDLLWEADPQATRRAIEGLRYHFTQAQPTTFRFNRHATFDKPSHPADKGAQPWIKHSSLYCHAYLFLHARTQDADALVRARGCGSLYWNARNPETNLTEGCLGDPRDTSRHATVSGIPLLAYWLIKAYEQHPQEKDLRERALTLLKAYDRYGYDEAKGAYLGALTTAGRPVGKPATVWEIAYGDAGVLYLGRVAAYAARTQKDADCLKIARRVGAMVQQAPLPKDFTLQGIGFALNLNLDLYDLTAEKAYLAEATRYADLAVEAFWRRGLFVRQTGDRYYEAKLGVGDLLAGLLRLHLRRHNLPDPGGYDWSF